MCGGGSNDAGGAPQLTEFRMPPVSTTVSVQREPSGHNLKHPTKWCPPNK